jgi:hypothetical protein
MNDNKESVIVLEEDNTPRERSVCNNCTKKDTCEDFAEYNIVGCYYHEGGGQNEPRKN